MVDKDWCLGKFELHTRYVDGNFRKDTLVQHVLGPRGAKKKRLIARFDYEPDGESILSLLNSFHTLNANMLNLRKGESNA